MSRRRTAPTRTPWIVAGVLGVIAAALAVSLIAFHLPSRHDRNGYPAGFDGLTSSERTALGSARQVVLNILSLSRAQYATEYQRVLGETTGDLRKDINTSFPKLHKQMIAKKYDTQGQITYAGIQATESSKISVIVTATVNQLSDGAGALVAGSQRFLITMTKVKGSWLASGLTSVGLT